MRSSWKPRKASSTSSKVNTIFRKCVGQLFMDANSNIRGVSTVQWHEQTESQGPG